VARFRKTKLLRFVGDHIHEQFSLGCTRFLRRYRRSCVQKDFPVAAGEVKRGHLNVPVIGVAKAGWNLDQLRARAKDSLEKHGGLDPAAFEQLTHLLPICGRRL
jgi:hypothetical protein